MRASGVEREDLVLIPDVTFWATFEAVINVGAKPICIDVDESSGGVDEEIFYEAAKKFKPKAAILAHLYGWGTPNLKKIRSFCEAENIILIEDGAQCFGGELPESSHIQRCSYFYHIILSCQGFRCGLGMAVQFLPTMKT